MKSRIGNLLVALAALTADAQYLCLNGQKYIVHDMEYVLVSPSSWDSLTNTVEILRELTAERWRKDHETAKGREMWHGKETNRVVTATGITWLYRDGFTYFEGPAVKVRRDRPQTARNPAPAAPAKPTRPSLPPRLAEKREAVKSRAGRVREVNAVFGREGAESR